MNDQSKWQQSAAWANASGPVDDMDALGWDDTISSDSEFVLLPQGDYPFTVVGLERARHNGSTNLPPCNKAVVKLEVTGENSAKVLLTHNLFLHRKCEGLLCAFFVAIGLRKKGEPLAMPWNKVVGCTGMARIGVRKYTSRTTGEEREVNEVVRFLEKNEASVLPTPPVTPQAPGAPVGAYTAGTF